MKKVLIYRYGQFSHLWADMFKRLGLDTHFVEREWGTGTPPEEVEKTLKSRHKSRNQGSLCNTKRNCYWSYISC